MSPTAGPAIRLAASRPLARPSWLAILSTYPPRRCGIATFASDLRAAVGGGHVAVLRRTDDEDGYPAEVAWQIDRDRRIDYQAVAAGLPAAGIRAVSIQHEYGIFGGENGAWVVDFLDALDVPAIVTFHTVLPHPSASQRAVLERLVERAGSTVVMSSAAAHLLRAEYGAEPARLRVIHHGVPDLPLVDPNRGKPALGLAGRTVILSFGLIGPGKGYEHMIQALDELRRTAPDVLFVILGATHPDLVRAEGERYRDRLKNQVAMLRLEDHVRFENRYVDRWELGRWLLAADIYVTPYPNLDQITSGTLSYAVGAGKAIVSTPYAHARELLGDGRGVLVEPSSGPALAAGIAPLLEQPALRRELSRRAWTYGRRMIWSQVGGAYQKAFAEAITTRRHARRHSPVLTTALSRRPLPTHGEPVHG